MKFTRFFCAALLATVVSGGLAAGASAHENPRATESAPAFAPCENGPLDTEWTYCPPIL
ncbi:hypothetical protein [Streptomyces sp. WAC06614]|uniref:hypothetical protein n=1 Tax=Streptomyces sp. WAC06614 TaxID=2487416 RepID=UPI00163BE754|nr:hypothetical protein [Streptomyces sp. WAC06614]